MCGFISHSEAFFMIDFFLFCFYLFVLSCFFHFGDEDYDEVLIKKGNPQMPSTNSRASVLKLYNSEPCNKQYQNNHHIHQIFIQSWCFIPSFSYYSYQNDQYEFTVICPIFSFSVLHLHKISISFSNVNIVTIWNGWRMIYFAMSDNEARRWIFENLVLILLFLVHGNTLYKQLSS